MKALIRCTPLVVMVACADVLNLGALTEDASSSGDAGEDVTRTLLTLGDPQDFPAHIALDVSNVNWVTEPPSTPTTSGFVGQCAKAGCGGLPFELDPASTTSAHLTGLAMTTNGERFYWSEAETGSIFTDSTVGGGTPQTFATGLGNPQAVVIDAQNVYWVDPGQGDIMSCSRFSVCTPTPLRQGDLGTISVVVDVSHAYWIGSGHGNGDGFIARCDLNPPGTNYKTIATGITTPVGLANDLMFVYWTDQANGAVMKVPINGGSPVTIAPNQPNPSAITSDGTNVYWTNVATGAHDGSIMRCSATNCTKPITLAMNQTNPTSIAVDASSVYWLNSAAAANGGAVEQLTPK